MFAFIIIDTIIILGLRNIKINRIGPLFSKVTQSGQRKHGGKQCKKGIAVMRWGKVPPTLTGKIWRDLLWKEDFELGFGN